MLKLEELIPGDLDAVEFNHTLDRCEYFIKVVIENL